MPSIYVFTFSLCRTPNLSNITPCLWTRSLYWLWFCAVMFTSKYCTRLRSFFNYLISYCPRLAFLFLKTMYRAPFVCIKTIKCTTVYQNRICLYNIYRYMFRHFNIIRHKCSNLARQKT
jgi:hypothetical protein